jgi:uncharacterized protein (DUF2461 family)
LLSPQAQPFGKAPRRAIQELRTPLTELELRTPLTELADDATQCVISASRKIRAHKSDSD